MAPVHHTPWLEAMDDTMKTFLAVKGQAAAE
jgi:trimethylamine monooxygenase